MENENKIKETRTPSVEEKYMNLIRENACRFVVRDGYRWDNSPQIQKDEFERILTLASFEDESSQILRYLRKMTYATSSLIEAAAKRYAKEKKRADVVVNADYLRTLTIDLVRLGAVDRRKYVPAKTKGKTDDYLLECFTLTQRGVTLYKKFTEYAGHIEEFLVKENSIEVMRRLATNYILSEFEPICTKTGFETRFCRTEKPRREGEPSTTRRTVYGSIEGKDTFTVFEPVFYHLDPNEDEDEFRTHIEDRVNFLKMYLKTIDENKQKCIVFVVEDKGYIKKAWRDYAEVRDRFDLVYVTSDSLVRLASDGVAPFLRIWDPLNSDEENISLKAHAEAPPFLEGAVKKATRTKAKK